MTSATTERLPPFAGGPGTSSFARSRDARVIEHAREQAADALAGRTVWCLAAEPAEPATTLHACLSASAEAGVATSWRGVEASAGLRRLAHLLDAMLAGTASAPAALGPEQRAAFAAAVEDGEALLGDDVRAGDVVVLHDACAATLAEAVRARGAHAVRHVAMPPDAPAHAPAVAAAWAFLRPFERAVDAWVVTERAPSNAPAARSERLAAALPAPGHLALKEVAPDAAAQAGAGAALGWRAVLADVVGEDREEHVGGTLHARPAIPIH